MFTKFLHKEVFLPYKQTIKKAVFNFWKIHAYILGSLCLCVTSFSARMDDWKPSLYVVSADPTVCDFTVVTVSQRRVMQGQ